MFQKYHRPNLLNFLNLLNIFNFSFVFLHYLPVKMTIVQQACNDVSGFESLYQKFLRRMSIHDRAISTSVNYGRSLAAIASYFKRIPTSLSLEEVEEYLYISKNDPGRGSDNHFKFTICALRFLFRMEGMDELRLKLPSLRGKRRLPVVLSKSEITAMMNIPCRLEHRVMIALLYGCGLRCAEVRNLKVNDIDLSRKVLLVRHGKGKKDRYMPLGNVLPSILEEYLKIRKPSVWLFPGKRWGRTSNRFFAEFEPQFGQRSIQWAVKRAAQVAGISKHVNVHSLRHTFATHLLEDGVNILTIQELMGHANIRTTMIYLHVAQVNNRQKCSPIDKLEGLRVIGHVQGELNFN